MCIRDRRKASEIRDERDQRVALSQTHVNPLKWLGMAFLGLLTLLSIAVVHVERCLLYTSRCV